MVGQKETLEKRESGEGKRRERGEERSILPHGTPPLGSLNILKSTPFFSF